MNNGISDGVGKITYLDGVTYIGSFRNGAKNGKGIKTYPNHEASVKFVGIQHLPCSGRI